jgi:hypothetical protein
VTASLARLASGLNGNSVRALLIGVHAANLYAPAGQAIFPTRDADFFLPLDPDNLLRAWTTCEQCGLECWLGLEPLERPRDHWLARRVVEHRALTRVTGLPEGDVDFTLVMAGFDFETVWDNRRTFAIDGVPLDVARLEHIIKSKAGREKDRLFLATHRDALEQVLKRQL